MNEQDHAQSTSAGTHTGPCPCQQIAEGVRQLLGVPAVAKQHLNNSRIEFLKALRAVLDARIEHLQGPAQKGTHVAVE
jgi:hypothetical protein